MSKSALKMLLARKKRGTLPDRALHDAMKLALRDRYGIEHFYFGAKQSGKSLSRTLSVICLVNKKLSKRGLNKLQLICLPKTICCAAGDKIPRFRTDVQELGGKFVEAAAIMNPGDNVIGREGRAFGTVGLFGRHSKHGVVCTTAGHVVRDIKAKGNRPSDFMLYDREQRVRLACTVKRCQTEGQIDYALLRPQLQSDNEWFGLRDHDIVEPYPQPKRSDVSRPLWLLTRGQATRTRFKGIKLDAFRFGNRRYANVILTEPIGKKGDSGGALVDDQYRIWGTLIGTRKGAFSMFMRINTLLKHEHFLFGLDEE